jgi:hypothetical protein
MHGAAYNPAVHITNIVGLLRCGESGSVGKVGNGKAGRKDGEKNQKRSAV